MTVPIRIRAAQPRDKRAVRELCARIWADDYILDVFDEWVRDRRGRFWVATLGERVVGIAKLTVSGDREAWLHALRVDPRHRRRGVATALLAHRLERARHLGARVARLDTAEDNVAVRRLVRRFGFRAITLVGYFETPARGAGEPRRAMVAELPALWRLVASGDGLLHEAHFARRLTRGDLAGAVRAGRCLVAGAKGHPSAFAIVDPQHRAGPTGRSRIAIGALGGTSRGLGELLRALPAYAKETGFSRVGSPTPRKLWPALRRAGYRKRWHSMFIFERALRPR